jgi:carbon starvation protein CstA
MKPILFKFLGRASDLAAVEPLLALFLGAALLAVFFSAFLQTKSSTDPAGKSSLLWTLYGQFTRLAMALMLVALLVATISVLRIYLRQAVSNFQRTHGRVTQANYNAVQTIWGAEQEQGE